jgi:hypothetical protein
MKEHIGASVPRQVRLNASTTPVSSFGTPLRPRALQICEEKLRTSSGEEDEEEGRRRWRHDHAKGGGDSWWR